MYKKPIIKHHALSPWVIQYPLQNFKGTDSMQVIFSIQCGLFFSPLLYSMCQIWFLWQSVLHKVKGSFSALPFFFLPPIWLNWFISYYKLILSLKCDLWCFKWIHHGLNDAVEHSFHFKAQATGSGDLDGNMTLPSSKLWKRALDFPGLSFSSVQNQGKSEATILHLLSSLRLS